MNIAVPTKAKGKETKVAIIQNQKNPTSVFIGNDLGIDESSTPTIKTVAVNAKAKSGAVNPPAKIIES